jgi:hypothetical protein
MPLLDMPEAAYGRSAAARYDLRVAHRLIDLPG